MHRRTAMGHSMRTFYDGPGLWLPETSRKQRLVRLAAHRFAPALIAFCFVAVNPWMTPSHGQEIHWINTTSTDNDFNEPTNWLENIPPIGQTCVFDQAAKYEVAFPMDASSVRFFVLAGDVAFAGNSTYTVTSSARSEINDGGKLTLSGLTLDCTSSLFDGIVVGGSQSGMLNLEDGARVINGYFGQVGRDVGSNGVVNLSGNSSWNTQELLVGWLGDGAVSITDGSSISTIKSTIGQSVDSVGEMTIQGADSSLQVTFGFGNTVGEFGTGMLRIEDGAQVNLTNRIGLEPGSFGTVIVTGTDSRLTGSQTVGVQGVGEMIIENGGFVMGSLTAGDSSSASSFGTIRIDGFGSRWTTTNTAQLGNLGDVILEVTSEGNLTTNGAVMGSSFSSMTVATIRDPGSFWNNTGDLTIGTNGGDCVFVEDQATLASQNLKVGGGGLLTINDGTVNVIETMEIEPSGEVGITGSAFGALFTGDLIHAGNLFIDSQRTVFVSGTYFDQASGFTGPGTLFISGVMDLKNSVDSIVFGGDLILGEETILEIALADNSSDQLVVSDDLFVSGILTLDYENLEGLDQNELLIIADVSGSRLGTFENLAEGDQILHDPATGLFITYEAGDGNDIALYGGPAELDFVADTLDIFRGIVIAGDVGDLSESDNSYLKLNPGITLSSEEPPVGFGVSTLLPTDDPTSMSFTFEARVNTPGVRQKIELFVIEENAFEEIDHRFATTTDSSITIELNGDVSRFVDKQRVRARLSWKPAGPLSVFPWTVCADQVVWTITQ